MEKVILVSDNSDGSNWGCYATSRELRELINERYDIAESIFLGDLRYNDFNFNIPSLTDINYVLSEYKKILTSSDNFPDKIYDFGIKGTSHFWDFLPKTVNQFKPKSEKFINSDTHGKFLSKIKEVDHVIINGEGSIHGDRRKSQMLLFLAYLSKYEMGINTHIVNHTLQIDTPRIEKVVKLIYPGLDTIAFRDPISVEQYKSKIGEGNIVATTDAAWLFDDFVSKNKLNELYQSGGLSVWTPNFDSKVDFNQKYICIGGGSGFSREDEYVAEGFTRLVQKIQDEFKNYSIFLTAAASSDETFMLKVSERTGAPLVKLNNDVRVAASVISNSDAYLGGRWHPTIFALLGNAQIVSFQGNTFKMQSIREQLSSNHPVYETKELYSNCNDIVESVSYGLTKGFENVCLDDNKMSQMKNLGKKNISSINKTNGT